MNPLIPVLAGWELTDEIIESFTSRFDYLLPFQQKVLKRPELIQHQSIIIGAPGSAGKTLISEVIALHHILKGNKVIYLLPLKATIEEKYRYFKQCYQTYGINIVYATADNRTFDHDILQGNFQLAILVNEKFLQLWSQSNQMLNNTGLVIVDEIQTLGDEHRGGTLEQILTLLKHQKNPAQLIGLCPIPEYAETIAKWFGALTIIDTKRPVPLHEGILYQGTYYYYDEQQAAKQLRLTKDTWEDPTDELFANLLALIESG
jgi:helicase